MSRVRMCRPRNYWQNHGESDLERAAHVDFTELMVSWLSTALHVVSS
jgi:hypothetical protein